MAPSALGDRICIPITSIRVTSLCGTVIWNRGWQRVPWTMTPLLIAPIAGKLVDRIGTRALAAPGLVLQALGFLWILHEAHNHAPYAQFVVPFVLAGVGISMALPAPSAAGLNAAPPALLGRRPEHAPAARAGRRRSGGHHRLRRPRLTRRPSTDLVRLRASNGHRSHNLAPPRPRSPGNLASPPRPEPRGSLVARSGRGRRRRLTRSRVGQLMGRAETRRKAAGVEVQSAWAARDGALRKRGLFA